MEVGNLGHQSQLHRLVHCFRIVVVLLSINKRMKILESSTLGILLSNGVLFLC